MLILTWQKVSSSRSVIYVADLDVHIVGTVAVNVIYAVDMPALHLHSKF